MTNGDIIRTAAANLGRRKLRSLLASLGVVVGTLTIVLLISLATGVRAQINKQFESLGLDRLSVRPSAGGGGFGRGGGGGGGGRGLAGLAGRAGNGNAANPPAKRMISPEDVARWRALPGVLKAIPEVDLPNAVGLELQRNDRTRAVSMGGGQNTGIGALAAPPAPVAGTLELPEAGGLIASEAALQALGVVGSEVEGLIGQSFDAVLRTSRGETQVFPLKLVGVIAGRGATIQVSPVNRIAMKSWWFNKPDILETEGYDMVTFRTSDVTRAHELSTQLRAEGLQVQSLEAIVEVADRILVAITTMLALLASVALVVATIGIANTMVMAIYERTREIGVLKAMGASSAEIRRLFMIEAGFIGLIGGVVGLLSGWFAGVVLNLGIAWYFRSQDMTVRGDFFTMTVALAAGTILFAIMIGTVAGLLPARRAARLDPLVALRHE